MTVIICERQGSLGSSQFILQDPQLSPVTLEATTQVTCISEQQLIVTGVLWEGMQ